MEESIWTKEKKGFIEYCETIAGKKSGLLEGLQRENENQRIKLHAFI